MNLLKTVGGVKVYADTGALLYKTGAMINADGALTAYAPKDSNLPALDYLDNAGKPGNWWGICTDSKDQPIVQSIYQPAPGYYISTTALTVPGAPEADPSRYVDSERYPFMVVPGNFGEGWKLGDVGFCYNEKTGDNMYCATVDIGPQSKIGEVSMLLARCLGIPNSPKSGGAISGIVYVVFPGSDPGYKPWNAKCQIALDTFGKWGGLTKLKTLIPQL